MLRMKVERFWGTFRLQYFLNVCQDMSSQQHLSTRVYRIWALSSAHLEDKCSLTLQNCTCISLVLFSTLLNLVWNRNIFWKQMPLLPNYHFINGTPAEWNFLNSDSHHSISGTDLKSDLRLHLGTTAFKNSLWKSWHRTQLAHAVGGQIGPTSFFGLL
jgi:hypothetical protein